jgi:hypothetical protein
MPLLRNNAKRILKIFFLSFILILSTIVLASVESQSKREGSNNDVKYRTSFGHCPTRSVGTLTLKLVKTFEAKNSLRDVKELLVNEKLIPKYFISWYRIQYDPMRKFLQLDFDCPEPLMRAQVYKNGQESYDAILVDNGELYDPTYETLLRTEQKLKGDLPFLALPVGELDAAAQHRITELVKSMDNTLRRKLSEVILSEDNELTIILSVQNRPTSVFVGNSDWMEKTVKLQKIIDYMESHNKIPAIINLINTKKVVVKFNDKF